MVLDIQLYVSVLIPLTSVPSCLLVWEGGSVWDLPLDPATPGPALEQLQQMEKAKAAKVGNSFFHSSACFPAAGHKHLLIVIGITLAAHTSSL